ncbi:MAG: glycoside hydrolase family 130 protein [Spirochaeta sp.]
MSTKTIVRNAPALPNIPWESKPASDHNVVWRYSKNPVIPQDLIPTSNSIFNSAVVPFKGGYAGVFRCDDTSRRMNIHRGISKDGITWEIDHSPIDFIKDHPGIPDQEYKYDPRVIPIGDTFYIVWCGGYRGACIGMGYTRDFETFHQLENPLMPYNRNGVLFPRKIQNKYILLSRPSDSGHTPFGDIFLSASPDMQHWGGHRFVMGPTGSDSGWQTTKIGAGPAPIETSEGWLLLYHGVLTSCNGFVYSMGGALLDLDEPWKVIARSRPYLLAPKTDYERVGDVQNVLFPCASLVDGDTGRLAIYYGAADTVTGLAFGYVDEIVDFIRNNSL